MRRTIAALVGGLLLASWPVTAQAGGLELRLGRLFPRAESNLFVDVADLYLYQGGEISRSDWDGWTGGAEWNMVVARNVELGVHVDAYQRTLHTSSRDFTWDSGREIMQTLKLNIVPLGFSVRLVPTGRRARVRPYLAAGADLFFWRYEEYGDFVDYESYRPRDETFDVFEDAFLSEGVAVGGHVAAGLRVPFNDDLSLVTEGRYQWAKADMGEDFRGNRLDLSGASATLGVRFQF